MRLSCRHVKFVAVLTLAAWVVSVPRAQADRYGMTTWAAVAYSTSTGKYGYGKGYWSEVNAKRRAISECGASDAKVVALAGNAWVALAKGDDKSVYGYGLAETAEEARQIALRECRKRTTGCYIAVCVHSD